MKNKKIAYLILFQLLVLTIQAQEKTVKEILDKSSKLYLSTNEFKVNMTFTMFRGVSGNNITESYKGTMSKKGDYTKNQILDTEVHLFPNVNITIDEKNKILYYTRLKVNTQQNTPIDLSAFLEYFKKTQILDQENEWVIEMVSDQNVFSQIPYGKVIIHINKSDYSITKQVLYFSKAIPFKKENSNDFEQDFGRLQIDLKHNWKAKVDAKKLEDFVKNLNNKIELQKAFSTYKLVDQTEYNN